MMDTENGRGVEAGQVNAGAWVEAVPVRAAGVRPGAGLPVERPLLLTCEQAAAVLGVSRATFWTLHSCGRVPMPIRLSPRVVRWARGELEAWIAADCPNRADWEKAKETA